MGGDGGDQQGLAVDAHAGGTRTGRQLQNASGEDDRGCQQESEPRGVTVR
jgi:hypothetical protein